MERRERIEGVLAAARLVGGPTEDVELLPSDDLIRRDGELVYLEQGVAAVYVDEVFLRIAEGPDVVGAFELDVEEGRRGAALFKRAGQHAHLRVEALSACRCTVLLDPWLTWAGVEGLDSLAEHSLRAVLQERRAHEAAMRDFLDAEARFVGPPYFAPGVRLAVHLLRLPRAPDTGHPAVPGMADLAFLFLSGFDFRKAGRRNRYSEAAVMLPILDGARAMLFCPRLWPDNVMACALGREAFGLPKTLARTRVDFGPERVLATLVDEGEVRLFGRWAPGDEIGPGALADDVLDQLGATADRVGDWVEALFDKKIWALFGDASHVLVRAPGRDEAIPFVLRPEGARVWRLHAPDGLRLDVEGLQDAAWLQGWLVEGDVVMHAASRPGAPLPELEDQAGAVDEQAMSADDDALHHPGPEVLEVKGSGVEFFDGLPARSVRTGDYVGGFVADRFLVPDEGGLSLSKLPAISPQARLSALARQREAHLDILEDLDGSTAPGTSTSWQVYCWPKALVFVRVEPEKLPDKFSPHMAEDCDLVFWVRREGRQLEVTQAFCRRARDLLDLRRSGWPAHLAHFFGPTVLRYRPTGGRGPARDRLLHVSHGRMGNLVPDIDGLELRALPPLRHTFRWPDGLDTVGFTPWRIEEGATALSHNGVLRGLLVEGRGDPPRSYFVQGLSLELAP